MGRWVGGGGMWVGARSARAGKFARALTLLGSFWALERVSRMILHRTWKLGFVKSKAGSSETDLESRQG